MIIRLMEKKMTSNFTSAKKFIAILLGATALSACSVTSSNSGNAGDTANNVTRIDFECEQQVKQRESAMISNAQSGTYLALANHAERCISGISFFMNHPDNQTAMKFNALSVLNYLKAGDLSASQQSLDMFKKRFPRQDLVLNDFTSFIDTATVLLKRNDLTPHQISQLNINRNLRSELARQQYWSAN